MAGLSNSDKQNLTKEQQAQVAALKEQYAQAQKSGNTAAMEKAHADAEKIRSSAGYSGGTSGSGYSKLASNQGGQSADQVRQWVDDYTKAGYDKNRGWINGYSFLNVFITFLVVGSLLGIDRDVLIKSGSLYIPTLLCSLLGACVFGVVAGLIFGNDPLYLITSYVLPIMGGGAGAGAVPMAQVYSDATGQDSAGYLSFCMAILALGNIVAILMAVVMDLIGRAFPKMTGHGELLRVKNKSLEVESKKPAPAVTVDDIAAAIFICAGFFMLGQLVSKKILPTVFGVAIPNFAYMIIFAALANIFNLIPQNLREACRRCQHFCGNKLVWIQMVGMGISAINFSTMFSVASWQNVVIVLMIVIGCCVGSALFGWIVGFFPVESAITAGLCMANMGGAGDLAVLGAAKRMDLMVYAQISSRIGGAIVLLIASILFAFL